MINKLHLAMIELYKGDAKRIQHFCKAVSYTHLDVYKRQIVYYANMQGMRVVLVDM